MSNEAPTISKVSKEETSKKREIKPPAMQRASTGEHVSPAAIFQQARDEPRTLTPRNVLQLQRTIGNQAVGQLLTQTAGQQPIQKKKNNTGLPDDLKDGIEILSGIAMDDVRVHYNSTKPSELQALAYTQGTDIYVASGQERHLSHEAWHAVQQKQRRVRPTMQTSAGVPVNNDAGLEHEATLMGARAFQRKVSSHGNGSGRPSYESTSIDPVQKSSLLGQGVVQLVGDVVTIAREAAAHFGDTSHATWRELTTRMCWTAVGHCFYLAEKTKEEYKSDQDGKDLINSKDTKVIDSKAIPPEHIIGFFLKGEKGEEPVPKHVMLSLGGGQAAGNKNGCCLEKCHDLGWEVLTLPDVDTEGSYKHRGRTFVMRHKTFTT